MAKREHQKYGQLTHAGVDRLEQVLSDMGVVLDETQRQQMRETVGPRCSRKEETKYAAMWERFKGTDRPQHQTMEDTLESIGEQVRKING